MISLFILLPLYILGIQYERGGWWNLLLPITFIAWVIDVILNYTELALLMLDYPQRGEFTFSKRLSRIKQEQGKRGKLAQWISRILDAIAPSGKHIL